MIEQATVTTPGPVIEPENLPAQIVARHEEPFSLDFDLEPAAPRDHERVHLPDRMRVLEERPRKISGPNRAVRATLRPVAAQHQRKAAPIPDRQTRFQAPYLPSPAVCHGRRVRMNRTRVDQKRHAIEATGLKSVDADGGINEHYVDAATRTRRITDVSSLGAGGIGQLTVVQRVLRLVASQGVAYLP